MTTESEKEVIKGVILTAEYLKEAIWQFDMLLDEHLPSRGRHPCTDDEFEKAYRKAADAVIAELKPELEELSVEESYRFIWRLFFDMIDAGKDE